MLFIFDFWIEDAFIYYDAYYYCYVELMIIIVNFMIYFGFIAWNYLIFVMLIYNFIEMDHRIVNTH